MTRPPEISKSLVVLVNELLQSLQVIRDSLNGLSSGNDHQVIPLSGQLRALLLERNRDSLALLLHIAQEFDTRLTLFVMNEANTPLPDSMPEPVRRMAGFPFSSRRQLPGQKEMALEDLRSYVLIRSEGEDISLSEIIKHFADKAGGAHYAKRVPEKFSRILARTAPEFALLGQMPLIALRQIGQAVYDCGLRVIRHAAELDVYLHVGLPKAVPSTYLLDAQYPTTNMRLSITLDENLRLSAQAIGIDGTGLRLTIPEVVDWSRPHLIHVSLRQMEDVSTALRVALDDEVVSLELKSKRPVFLTKELRDYNMVLNKAFDGESTGGELILEQLVALGHSSPADHARALAGLLAEMGNVGARAVWYKAGSYGIATSGDSSITNIGEVILSTFDEAMSNGNA